MKAENQAMAARANSSGVGFLLLDAALDLIYANDDVIQLLSYPRNPREIEALNGFVANKIRSALFFNHHTSPQSLPPREFLSGRRHYRCRVFSVNSHLRDPSHATVVLFERSPRGSASISRT